MNQCTDLLFELTDLGIDIQTIDIRSMHMIVKSEALLLVRDS